MFTIWEKRADEWLIASGRRLAHKRAQLHRQRMGGDEDISHPHAGACGPSGVGFLAYTAVEGWTTKVLTKGV